MINSRREFIKKASLLAGASASLNFFPESIQRALSINAAEGSSYLDAEHVVFLMQENRSFDHCFGTLQGVRGYNDPRAMIQPNGLPVWFQQNQAKETFGPFHLDIENSKATWMGDLPHGWKDMVMARNNGKMDSWLEAKKPGNPEYQHIPLTMGYYNRKDIPFYYNLADAFTICDQNFSSSLTGTSANRSFFWSGTIRERAHDSDSVAHVDNSQINYKNVGWKTFPERLQESDVSWKVYQNELSLPSGMTAEEEDWLANFTDNNLEFHEQYHVKFHPHYYQFAKDKIQKLTNLLKVAKFSTEKAYSTVVNQLEGFKDDVEKYSPENFEKLPKNLQEIHKRAFVTNDGDPSFRKLENLEYQVAGESQNLHIPKGDVLYQFRNDVENGDLPTVSWMVAPCRFSDHPSSPWYGAWYISEILDILTKNPEVWKKTIFVLTYDENDGYFDHVSPYVAPLSSRVETGAVPYGMDTRTEYVTREQEKKRTKDENSSLESPIGLGYRVPMIIVSPWTKGGWVNSEVFDHTSSLQFLEHFIEKKFNKQVREENISPWRRLICGNLSSVFRNNFDNSKIDLEFVDRNKSITRIHSTQVKRLPGNYQQESLDALSQIRSDQNDNKLFGLQEPGTKPACALPYDLDVHIDLNYERKHITLEFDLAGKLPSTKIVGIPLQVISQTIYSQDETSGRVWDFAVRSNEKLVYQWPFSEFKENKYSLVVHGPNGFYRHFKGNFNPKKLQLEVVTIDFENGFAVKTGPNNLNLVVRDPSYGYLRKNILPSQSDKLFWDLSQSSGWYDFIIESPDDPDLYFRYAGHQESSKNSRTDPLMGNMVSK